MGIVLPFRGLKPSLNCKQILPGAPGLTLKWDEFQEHLQKTSLQAVGIELARRVLLEAMEQEADDICGGHKGRHLISKRRAFRHGYAPCSVSYGAARMELVRPRIRAADKEIPLSTYVAAQRNGLSPATVLEACLGGSSHRRFPRIACRLQGTDAGFRQLSKSTINRRFIRAADKVAHELRTRRLEGRRYVALYLDGVVEQRSHLIAVLGLTTDGEKHVLGLREGSSESGEVCQELLADLLSRGLDVGNGFLAIIDGGKGLGAALRAVFGHKVLIQRCRAHKIRNVLEKVPECEREHLKSHLQRAWKEPDARQAKRLLELIARNLDARGRKRAARSLREGLSDTLTCNFLGLPTDSDLTRSLVTTNPIESLFSRSNEQSRRVCRWRGGRMLFRWTALSLAESERSLSRIEDDVGLQQLALALEQRAAERKAAA